MSWCLLFAALRAGLVYFLYFEPISYQSVPFIYKVANDYSNTARATFVPVQLLLSLASAWACRPRKVRAPAA